MSTSDKKINKEFEGLGEDGPDTAAGGKKAYPPPFSLRLTFEERTALEEAAGGMPLGAFIREKLLGGELTPRRRRGRAPVKDHQALGQVLGELGNSRIANNLNQLARAANSGSLPVTPETEAALQAACEDVAEIRAAVMTARGFPAGPGAPGGGEPSP